LYIQEMSTSPTAVHVACVWEVTARKVGNVHPRADIPGLSYVQLVLSAGAIWDQIGSTFLTRMKVRRSRDPVFGLRVLNAVRMTRAIAGTNSNLGIALILAPLAAIFFDSSEGDPRVDLENVLGGLTVRDAEYVFEAIRLAEPGGLGDVPEQDVKDEPTVTLLEAMKLAADRDLIARQYANGYADVFDFGVPAFLGAYAKFGRVEPAIIECHLKWMAEFPDSLIARKNGRTVAEDVQRRVKHVFSLGGLDTAAGRAAGVELDAHLRSDGNKLNPGTSADLVAACLFVALREGKITPKAPFRWDVEDWL
jgi:triphosphoribosyl-dephospho-CoA synthase